MRFQYHQRGRHHLSACDQTVAHRGVVPFRITAQAIEVQTSALTRRDEKSCRAGTLSLWNVDVAIDAECGCNAVYGLKRLRTAGLEITARNRDAQSRGPLLKQRSDRLRGSVCAGRVIGIETLHGIISKRQILHVSRHRPDVIEACDEWEACCFHNLQRAQAARCDPRGELAGCAPGEVVGRWRIKHKRPTPARCHLQARIRRRV